MSYVCPNCGIAVKFTGETRFVKDVEYHVKCACGYDAWQVFPREGPRTRLKSGKMWMIFCPACVCMHYLDSAWDFTGTVEHPTFSPSLLVEYGGSDKCHSFVKEGKIQYCPDSSHKLAGQTVALPVIDDDMSVSCLRRHDNYEAR